MTTSSFYLGVPSYSSWAIGSVEQINLLVVLTPQVARILGQKELNVTSPRAKYSPPRIRSTTVGLLVNTRHSPLNDAKDGYACRHRLGQEHKQFSGGRQSARLRAGTGVIIAGGKGVSSNLQSRMLFTDGEPICL
jgi:hypothetical protein